VWKLDRPSLNHPSYHIVRGEGPDAPHTDISHYRGEFFDDVSKFSDGFLAVGLIYSGYRILSPYNEDVAEGHGVDNTRIALAEEGAGWGGVILGAETGAAIGSLFPGPGTLVGAVLGGVIGGFLGQTGVDYLMSRLPTSPQYSSGGLMMPSGPGIRAL